MAAAEVVFEVDEAAEGGYTARALGHAIFTEADTLDELRAMVRGAVQVHFDEGEAPRRVRLRMVGSRL